ncbi:hypothetical protein THAOC_10772 [Thalassiosira oceanica]|uniref:Uncharacterized protein n=1 Tax=Thalassiosira oceanica TaxID=159749 RepID=K0ST01_THAOC|nr:hypothetical protein THAOC_10772 [Thalassiosira oceanica]|eukprot:EJK68089.1 hypothetical protein THAOC_10772 [Thalassiosira oceanica]
MIALASRSALSFPGCSPLEPCPGTGRSKRRHIKTIALSAISALQTNPNPDGIEYCRVAPICRANTFTYHHTGPKHPEYDEKKTSLQQEIDEMVHGKLIVLRMNDHNLVERWLQFSLKLKSRDNHCMQLSLSCPLFVILSHPAWQNLPEGPSDNTLLRKVVTNMTLVVCSVWVCMGSLLGVRASSAGKYELTNTNLPAYGVVEPYGYPYIAS